MQICSYTVALVHDARGPIRKFRLPAYLVHFILLAALVGAATALAGIASFAHVLLTFTRYREVRAERELLERRNRALQTAHAQTYQRLTSLESLANEVAATHGLLRLGRTPFAGLGRRREPVVGAEDFRDTLARYRFLRHHATAVTLYASGIRPWRGQDLTQLSYTPSLWPVRGRLSGSFGNRMDPFSGGGSFHRGVDISSDLGKAVHAAADGFVVAVGQMPGYGRVVVVDHGGGLTTWYAHLSEFRAYRGQAVQRGDIIGTVGSSGRSTGPHLHYEVRLWGSALNPWRFLRTGTVYSARARPLPVSDGD